MTEAESTAYSSARRRASAATERQWTRTEAIRTRTIWLVVLAYGVANVGLMAMMLHMIPFLTDNGFSRGTAALLFSVQAWSSLLSKPAWGVLMDRFHARMLSAAGFLISAASIVALLGAASLESEPLVMGALIAYGFGVGGTMPLQETVWASYFGRFHLGEIRAVAMPFSIIFSAGGPLLAGTLYDRSGSYTSAFVIFTVFSILGFMLILLARPPVPPGGDKTPAAGPTPPAKAPIPS